MTNEEAIDVLKEEWRINAELFGAQFGDALALAIKALEEKPQGDLISREALRKALLDAYKEYDGYEPNDLARFAERVDNEIDNAPTISIDMGIANGDRTAYARPTGECCGSCYLCDVGDCKAGLQEGGAE